MCQVMDIWYPVFLRLLSQNLEVISNKYVVVISDKYVAVISDIYVPIISDKYVTLCGKVFLLLFSKESFCYQPVWLLTFVNRSKKTLKKFVI